MTHTCNSSAKEEHSHTCKGCGHKWFHFDGSLDCEECHTCRECGTISWWGDIGSRRAVKMKAKNG